MRECGRTKATRKSPRDVVRAVRVLIEQTLAACDSRDVKTAAKNTNRLITIDTLVKQFISAAAIKIAEMKASLPFDQDRARAFLQAWEAPNESIGPDAANEYYRSNVNGIERLVAEHQQAREKGRTEDADRLRPFLSEIHALTEPFAEQEAQG